MVTVTFDEYGLKKMLAGFAKLKSLNMVTNKICCDTIYLL